MSDNDLKTKLEMMERELAVLKTQVAALTDTIHRYGTIIVLAACFGSKAFDVLTKFLGV